MQGSRCQRFLMILDGWAFGVEVLARQSEQWLRGRRLAVGYVCNGERVAAGMAFTQSRAWLASVGGSNKKKGKKKEQPVATFCGLRLVGLPLDTGTIM